MGVATAFSGLDVFRNWAVTPRRWFRAGLVLSGIVVVGTDAAQAQEAGLLIRQLTFEGNHAIATLALEAAISTTKSSWFVRSAGRLSRPTRAEPHCGT